MRYITKTYATEQGDICREVFDSVTGVWHIDEKLKGIDVLRISLETIEGIKVVYEREITSNANTQG